MYLIYSVILLYLIDTWLKLILLRLSLSNSRSELKNWSYAQFNVYRIFFNYSSRKSFFKAQNWIPSICIVETDYFLKKGERYSLCAHLSDRPRHLSVVTRSVSTSESLFLSLLAAPRFKGFRNPNGARDRTLGARKIVGKNTLYRSVVRESRDSAGREIRGLERPRPTSLAFCPLYIRC